MKKQTKQYRYRARSEEADTEKNRRLHSPLTMAVPSKSDLFKDAMGLEGTQGLVKDVMAGSQDMAKEGQKNASDMAKLAMVYNLNEQAIKAGRKTKQQAAQEEKRAFDEVLKTDADRKKEAYNDRIAK